MKPGSSICEIGKAWISYGLSLFLLFTLDYLSEHSYSHTGLILFITGNLLCYLHFAFCLLYGWLNVSVPLIDLTIRAGLGNHVILRDWKGGPWRQIKKQKLYNIQLSLPKQTKPSGSPDLPIYLIYGKFGPKAHNLKDQSF